MKSQIRSFNVSPQPTKQEHSKQYINFMKFRHQNLIKMHIEEPVSQIEPQMNKNRKPHLIFANGGICHWKKYRAQSKSSLKQSPMKLEMKEKMKGRMKVQIQSILKAHTISFDKTLNKAEQNEKQKKKTNQTVCVIGSSLKSTQQTPNNKSKPRLNSKLLEIQPFTPTQPQQSTNQTSFHRHSTNKGSPRIQEIERRKVQSGRSSTSSGIRMKSTINRKSSQRGFHKKIEAYKEDEVKPWIIPQFFQEEIIF